MKKILYIVSMFLFPVIASAQGYMMNYFNRGGYGCGDFGFGNSMLGFFIFIPIIGMIVAICVFIFWLLMLVDAIKHAPEKSKMIWVIVIIFTHIIGALIYYFVEKRPKDKVKAEHKVDNN